ncbi:MAG: hypothetical protein M1825_001697 [Sarcosagium campestre]|nr:MAG: hypothetical protein M1825_001697 [Sarcosagium campestre]
MPVTMSRGQAEPVNFDLIETQKENIQTLPGGRSARTLASVFSASPMAALCSPTPSDTLNVNEAVRQEFETEILSIAESDDPLDIYDRYVRWALDAYPAAQATQQSQLLPLLERATKAFLTSTHYRNDPRYLKLWLHYIRLFSDAPRETFAFLARHNIGETLALFYEEFAAWLETTDRWAQADEVYRLGVDRQARPVERLMRKYGEFQRRLAQRPQLSEGPSSPALPAVRPALAAKVDPFAPGSVRSTDPQAQNASASGSATGQRRRQKLSVFSDSDAASAPATSGTADPTKGWENIGSLGERRKENVMEARPWTGETLKAGKRTGTVGKMMVFKDESISNPIVRSVAPSKHPLHQREARNPRTGRIERVFVNLQAIYPSGDVGSVEMSFEELRAANRGWFQKDWSKVAEIEREDVTETVQDFDENHVSPQLESHRPCIEDQDAAPQNSRVKEVRGETQTIKLNLDSPTGSKSKSKKTKEPTMTFHTRAATDEIYDIFNQPLQTSNKAGPEEESTVESEGDDEDEEDDDRGDEDEDDDDYTSVGDSTGTGTGTGRASTTEEVVDEDADSDAKSVSEWSDFSVGRHIPNLEYGAEDSNEQREPDAASPMRSQSHEFNILEDHLGDGQECLPDNLATPISPERPSTRAKFIPSPPQDYEVPTQPFRDAIQATQNRLPFMTPIVEKTESSLGLPTIVKDDRDYFSLKTPSRAQGRTTTTPVRSRVDIEDIISSPFEELVNECIAARKATAPPAIKPLTKLKVAAAAPKPSTRISKAAKKTMATPGDAIIQDAQCNPMESGIRKTILENLQPALKSYDGFFDRRSEMLGKTIEIRRYSKALAKAAKGSSDRTSSSPASPPLIKLRGTDRQYIVKRELGKGAFAPVYLIESEPIEWDSSTDSSDESEMAAAAENRRDQSNRPARRTLEALKMEENPSAWEFYMLRQAEERLAGTREAESLVRAHEFHLYADECYLIEDFREQGTLLDFINLAKTDISTGGVMDEQLAMFFAIELLRVIEALHSKDIIHGDLKADNCLVRFDNHSSATSFYQHAASASGSIPGSPTSATSIEVKATTIETVAAVTAASTSSSSSLSTLSSSLFTSADTAFAATPTMTAMTPPSSAPQDLSPRYRRDGSGGWASKGLALIDFGRGIDMRQFRADVGFIADWETGPCDCAEMRELRPWTYQIDYHAAAGVLHTLLFGRYIDTVVVPDRVPYPTQSSSSSTTNPDLDNLGLGAGFPAPTRKNKTYRVAERMKRYWQVELWTAVFDVLLNPTRFVDEHEDEQTAADAELVGISTAAGGNGRMPPLKALRRCRVALEDWLEAHCERGVGLKTLLRRMEERVKEKASAAATASCRR